MRRERTPANRREHRSESTSWGHWFEPSTAHRKARHKGSSFSYDVVSNALIRVSSPPGSDIVDVRVDFFPIGMSATSKRERGAAAVWAASRFRGPNPHESPGNGEHLRGRSEAHRWAQSRMNKRVAPQNDRTHDPLAMQKVVGSSPIIRSQNPSKTGVFVFKAGDVSPR
jgi:hypothetical protein